MLSPLKRDQIKGYLLNPETFATTLLTIIIDNYGTEALNADLGLVLDDLCRDFNVDRLPPVNSDKIGAMIIGLTTDLFYTDWSTFNQVCEALNNDPVHPDVLDPATPEQMAWAVVEMAMHEDPKTKPQFSDNVATYVGVLLKNVGLTRAPADLGFAKLGETRFPALEADSTLAETYYKRLDSDLGFIQSYVLNRAKLLFQELNSIPLQSRNESSWKGFFETVHKKLKP